MNNFMISWNGSRIFVDLKEDNQQGRVYVLRAPKQKRDMELTSHIDATGTEHWLERGKETEDSARIGALIEMARYQHSSHWGI